MKPNKLLRVRVWKFLQYSGTTYSKLGAEIVGLGPHPLMVLNQYCQKKYYTNYHFIKESIKPKNIYSCYEYHKDNPKLSRWSADFELVWKS